MRCRTAAWMAILIAGLGACGGSDPEPAAPAQAVWSAARDTGHAPQGWYAVARLGNGAVALLEQLSEPGAEGAQVHRVQLILRDAEGRETLRRELLRADDPSCCWMLPGHLRLVADGRGGAFMAWTQGLMEAPYRQLQVMHLSPTGAIGAAWSPVRTPSHAGVGVELAVDASGTATVLWAESVPDSPVTRSLGDTTLWVQQATRDGPLGVAEAVSSTIPTNEAGLLALKLAISPGGGRAVAWANSGTGFVRNLWVRAAPAGGAFGPAMQVLDRVVVSGSSPTLRTLALDVTDNGRAVAAWSTNTTSPDRDVVGLALGGPAGLERTPWRAEPAALVSGAFVWGDQDALLLHLDPVQTGTEQPHLRLTRLAPAATTPVWQAEFTPRATQPWFLTGRSVAARLPAGQAAVAWTQTSRSAGTTVAELQRAVLSPDGRWTTESLGPVYDSTLQIAPEGPGGLSLFWVAPPGRIWVASAAVPR